MGVHGLWKILEQTADPVKLETLRGKTLAIDASIWIYHFLKAMRDPKGTVLAAAHVIGFFRRICKLMFFEIKPVFVFDGAPPILKKQTTRKRSERRVGREQSARATANKLLTIQLQRAAAHQKELQSANAGNGSTPGMTKVKGTVPKDAVYYEDLISQSVQPEASSSSNPAASQSQLKKTAFVPTDQYHLPEMNRIGPIRANDQRMLSEEELEEYAKQFTNQARAGFIDTSLVDFHSKEFDLLPVETQYQLLNMARMKSRLRMGYTADQLNEMFPDQMEFSKFQINRVSQRNYFTQRLLKLVGMDEDLTRRVSSEKNKEYFLKKTDQGWSLSLEEHQGRSADEQGFEKSDLTKSDLTKSEPALLQNVKKEEDADSESDAEFEEVDINAGPKLTAEEVQLNLTKEDSNMIDELFGYEAKLTREQLYDKLLFNMDSDDEDVPAPKGSAARSMLFGKSAKQALEEEFGKDSSDEPQHEPTHKRSPHAKASKQVRIREGSKKKLESEKTSDNAEKSKIEKVPSTPPVVPWFEEQGNFSEMKIAERQDKNFVPLDYVSEDEDDFEEVDLVHSSDGSQMGGTENTENEASQYQPAQETEVDVQLRAETTERHSQHDGNEVMTFEHHVEEAATEEEAGAVTVAPVAVAAPVAETAARSEEIEQEKEGQEIEASAANPVSVPTVPGSPQTLSPESQPTTPHQPESEPDQAVELSPEAIERANQEARDADEENEDIAGMLIAEAEENERFARELAAQNNQGWTQANESEYQTQISHLRSQFAQETRDADNISTEMIQECQELLQLFGIPYITAPAEAEAQCAELHALKLVDGVVTDDGDTFLFDDDARVYRNMFSQAKFVEFYSSKRIENRLGLDRRRMIDLAFLLGSDYTDGILGIGPVTSVEILAEFGDLRHFAEWWSEAQRFPDTADVNTSLKRRLLKNFQTKLYLPEDFPNPTIVDAYLHPAVDTDATKFSWGTPDLARLRLFMETTAGWDAAKTDATLLPVVQEASRRDLLEKTQRVVNQSRLDDYYRTVVQNPELGSKRAAKAAGVMRKRQKQ